MGQLSSRACNEGSRRAKQLVSLVEDKEEGEDRKRDGGHEDADEDEEGLGTVRAVVLAIIREQPHDDEVRAEGKQDDYPHDQKLRNTHANQHHNQPLSCQRQGKVGTRWGER